MTRAYQYFTPSRKTNGLLWSATLLGLALLFAQSAGAALIVDPDDARVWQGATVGTFATLFYGADTPANRQLVVDNELLDDGYFDTTGFNEAPLTQCVGCITAPGDSGRSLDTTGVGGYDYTAPGGVNREYAASHIDEYWIQTGNTIGGAVWDLGAGASTAIIFNTIDHGPLPQEAIESTVYLSDDQITWVQAETRRVWLEGYNPILGIVWDGFTYAVGAPSSETFRYATIIWGGPGALIADGDNEINGVMGANDIFEPPPVPAPATVTLLLLGMAGLVRHRRRR